MRIGRLGCLVGAVVGLLLTGGLVAAMVVFSALTQETRATAAETLQPRLVYGLTFMPSGFDPHINQNSELGIVFRSVYDTLLYRDPGTKALVPGLAEAVEISADGLVYTFKLRSGVTFHDGEPFNAAAVAATLDRIVNPDTKSQKSLPLLGPYSRYEVVDPLTIRVILNTPYAPLLDAFAQVYLGIASPKALREYDAARYQFHQVGTGPFRMVEYVPSDRIVLRRNPDYVWGPSFYQPPVPDQVQEIEFRFFEDVTARTAALLSGEAHIMGEMSPLDADQYARDGSIQLFPQPIPGQPLQFFMNTSAFPTNDLSVRRALLLVTNRTALVDSVFRQYSPVACGPLAAVTPFYDAKVCNLHKYAPQEARDLLALAGYTDADADGILDRVEGNVIKPLRIAIVTPPFGLVPQVVQKMQSQWREIGIAVEIRQVPNLAGIMAEFGKGDYNMISFTDYGLDAALLNRFYRSDGALNFSRWKNTDLDIWLDRAMVSNSDDERRALYGQAQVHIMDNALVLPIRDYVNLNAAALAVNGLAFDAYGWFPLLANVTVTEAGQ